MTVSGLHVKLNFVPLSGVDVNILHNVNLPTTTTTTTRSNYLFHSEHGPRDKEDDDTKGISTKAVQRYMVFFDAKCRHCFLNEDLLSKKDGDELLDASEPRSIKCHLKVIIK